MRIPSLLSYILSAFLIYSSLYIAEGNHLNLFYFWDLSAFVVMVAGSLFILVNFKFSEVYSAVADAISKNVRTGFEERYEINKLVIKSIGSYTMFASVMIFIMASIIILGSLQDTSKLGMSLALALISILYAVIIKFIFVIPLDTALDKKKTQIKG